MRLRITRHPYRNIRRSGTRVLLWSLPVMFLLTSRARAYVDPGTGSYILQMVIAGLLGSVFTIKLFGRRIKAFIQSRFSRGKDRREDDPQGGDE